MKKRKWVYIQKPIQYEISCDKCNGTNIDWSEFERMIWCYDCEIDTRGNAGIFDGPIPLQGCELLGFSLDRIYFKTGEWRKPDVEGSKVVYKPFACLLGLKPGACSNP